MEDKVNLIKKLLLIKKDYPFLAFKVESNGLVYDFYLKKGFWKQIYGRYVVEVFFYKPYKNFYTYTEVCQNKLSENITSLECFSAEDEALCEIEIQKFVFNLVKNGPINIIQNNLNLP